MSTILGTVVLISFIYLFKFKVQFNYCILNPSLAFCSNRDRWMSGKLVYAMHNNEEGKEAGRKEPTHDDHDELNAQGIQGDITN